MQVNRVNQQTNFKGAYFKYRPSGMWRSFDGGTLLPKDSLNISTYMDDLIIALTDKEASDFAGLRGKEQQRNFLDRFFGLI